MDYVATASVSDWALAMARTVLTNVLLTLKDRSQIDKFKGYRIMIVGDGDGDEAVQYPDVGITTFTRLRGNTNPARAIITEEMMCRTGIIHVPVDKVYRKYDQVVHEFGHTIHFKLDLEKEITKLQGGKFRPCGFAVMIQAMFDCDMQFGSTRERFLAQEPAKFVDFMRALFLLNREWRPQEVKYKHGSPDTAKVSEQDKLAAFKGFDDTAAENAALAEAESQSAKPDSL